MAFQPVVSRLFDTPNAGDISVYEQHGGYQAARKALGMEPSALIEEVKTSGLRGRGGAGFPAGMKWSFIPKDNPKPKYLVVNSDESEPGTFKDRKILERDPHSLVEGCIISAFAIGAHKAYIYLRGEFNQQRLHLDDAIRQAYEKGYLGDNVMGTGFKLDVYTHRGAGAYICGEETALLESLEGKKGQPRLKPPFPATHGAFQCPTVVNNVETIATVPWIINNGGAAYAAMGTEKAKGTRLMSVSGHINTPGVYEIEMGLPFKDFLANQLGGVWKGRGLKAVIPGGSSCPILTADEAMGTTLDPEAIAALGSMAGSGGMIVIDDQTDMVDLLEDLLHFYMHESCGQCTPCREGTDWLYKIVQRINAGMGTQEELDSILDIADNMEGKTICALAAAATMPTRSYIKKFRAEFEAKFKRSQSPVGTVATV
ncbi:NADH-quinone oxidoreductase subunit NuoF [bacterium]|nr:NADH-quinone oxidoreductase subunit NuoF [bacterium]